MTAKKNTFSVDQIQQIEIGRNGNIMPRLRDLDQDTTLKGSLLKVLYPAIKVASVNVPVEPLEEIEETRVRNTMGKVVYKGVRYKLVGASGSAKKGKFYFVDEQHHAAIAERFHNWPQAAITYFGILVSNCSSVIEMPDARVLVVSDHNLGTNDSRGWIRESIAFSQLSLPPGAFYQFRIAFEKTQGKGSLKLMKDDVADLLDVDVVLPESCMKPGLKIPAKVFQLFGDGRMFRGKIVLGIREVSRQLEFESSYTLTQHAPGDSIMAEILPQTTKLIDQVSSAVAKGHYGELLELIGHNPENLTDLRPEEEMGTVEALLLADTSGHIVKHPWVNGQLDKLLARWTFKACTGGAFHLPAFALADDGYLIVADGKIHHGSDWIPQHQAITLLPSRRGLCVRYPIRMFEDLLPLDHVSPTELKDRLQKELKNTGCASADTLAEQIVVSQLQLEGTYILHSETAKRNGGDFDFDLVGVVGEDRFPIWVSERFNLNHETPLTKTKASKEKHPWWNIVHVARKAVGNQIGSITDLITSCLAQGRPDFAQDLVLELQNALDSLKHGVEPDQKKISAIRRQVNQAPWLRLKNERRVSNLPMEVDVPETDKIGILYNHVRHHFNQLLTQKAPLEAFIGLIDGEQVTDKMIAECHYLQMAYGSIVASIAQREADLKKKLDEARREWDAVRRDPDKELQKRKMSAKNQAQAAYHFNQERTKDEMKALISFVKIWAQNKTVDRMAWAQALNSIVCRGKGKGTGSLIWLTFAQELVFRLADLTGGKKVLLYKPRLVEGYVRIDEHGRTYLVEAINGGLVETFLFKCKDGKVSLDGTVTVEESQLTEQSVTDVNQNTEPQQGNLAADASVEQTEPRQSAGTAQAAQVGEDDGLGHELETVEAAIEASPEFDETQEHVPF
jgi:hypothetical protein